MTELTIREIQLVSLEILHTVATICEEQNDDVDIMMPRRDYDRFLEYMKIHREEYPDLRIFNLEECKEYPYMITRISDDRYIIKMENEKPILRGELALMAAIVINSFSVVLMLYSGSGISAISSVPYAFS